MKDIFRKKFFIALVILFSAVLVSTLIFYIRNQYQTLSSLKEPHYPLEEWEQLPIWLKKGPPSSQPMPVELRGSLEKLEGNQWLYRNKYLNFEIVSFFHAKSLNDYQQISFEYISDDSPYNKLYMINLSGRRNEIYPVLTVNVRQTRYKSLDDWLAAANVTYTKDWLYVERWTTISGEKALIMGVKGNYSSPPKFEDIQRKVFIIKDGKLYMIETMQVMQDEYQRTLNSFRFFN